MWEVDSIIVTAVCCNHYVQQENIAAQTVNRVDKHYAIITCKGEHNTAHSPEAIVRLEQVLSKKNLYFHCNTFTTEPLEQTQEKDGILLSVYSIITREGNTQYI